MRDDSLFVRPGGLGCHLLRILEGMWVYEDEFVKGFINLDGKGITELYVDSFFENQGIGRKLVDFAIENYNSDHLWVLEKNIKKGDFMGDTDLQILETVNWKMVQRNILWS